MVDIRTFIQPHLLSLKPYSSARDEYSGEDGIFLDANENPFGSATGHGYNRYPDPYQRELKEAISQFKNIPENQIFLGNGSDEAIDLIIRLFCTPGRDNILITPPTYGMYEVSAGINNNMVLKSNLTSDFMLDMGDLKSSINAHSRIIFICRPNNPTGNLIDKDDVLEVISFFNGIVVVDEAYIDFVEDQSLINELKNFNNLVILQTFSKAWGLAGLRLGMAFADPLIIDFMNKIKPPYNINSATQELGLEAVKNREFRDNFIREIKSLREQLITELRKLPIVTHVYETSANFVLARFTDPNRIYHYLLDKKVIVRNRSNVVRCEGSLRITVGTREENECLIEELHKFTVS